MNLTSILAILSLLGLVFDLLDASEEGGGGPSGG